MRLNKFIAKSGECSRRQADKYLKGGSVTVNGSLELNPAYQVLGADDIRFDGRRITSSEKTITILLNKPMGYITTSHDPFKRKTVMDLINHKERLFPIGRLDKDTTGLLLLTNDGNLANLLTHPKNKIPRIYELEIDKPFESWEKKKISKKYILVKSSGVKLKF